MAAAVRGFLDAAGLEATSADLARTPERVAQAWCASFLDGYAQDPANILSRSLAAPSADPIALRDVAFHSMCPHHLLPFTGTAVVAYFPRVRVVGFSRLVRLVDCFAHRLTLQETIASAVARALVDHLDAAAAACGLDAEQQCVTIRGVSRHGTRIWTESFPGDRARFARLAVLLRS